MGIFKGIRVVEIGLYIATPLAGRILASLGAEILKIETTRAPDQMKMMPAKAPGAAHPFLGALKRKISLNMNVSEGRRIARELIKRSDVFIHNFSIDAVQKWEIDYDTIQEIKPDIIYVWQSGMGMEGPYSSYKAYGGQLQSITGIQSLTGFPDKPPTQANNAFCDFHSSVYCALLITGALRRKRRTGKGTFIEIPLFETGAISVGANLLEYAANGIPPKRIGNHHRYASPHNAYPCKGEDRWCVISVFTDGQWRMLCHVAGHPEWLEQPEFATLAMRKRNEDLLDNLISEWTKHQEAKELAKALQAAGIPAGWVMKGEDLVADAHFKTRGFYWLTEYHKQPFTKDAETAPGIAMSIPMNFAQTPCQNGSVGYVGRDNDYVYEQILGMSREEIKKLEEQGALI
jgi:benzylsuccinate CoA-transferase BbsF subunit